MRQPTLADLEAAQQRLAGNIVKTPCLHSRTLSAISGAEVYLKFENLQYTASFKERGALNCLLQLNETERQAGVIAMSAGNHAQGLAYHGSRLGVPTCIVMPRLTPNTKVERTQVLGAEVVLHGTTFDETRAHTQELARRRGMVLVHPFDDARVIAGQGSIGLEIAEQVPDAQMIVVPVGGGGLISGIALAVADKPIEVIGVQVERYAGVTASFHGTQLLVSDLATVAEGIAVKAPGVLTMPIIKQHVCNVLTVSEPQAEQAVFDLLDIEKTVVEGAGAVGWAALCAQPELFRNKRVVVLLSGGNIEMLTLSSLLKRGLVRSGRLVRVTVKLPDVPGALAELTSRLADLQSNIIDINLQSVFADTSIRATEAEMTLQLRGQEHADGVLAALQDMGYAARTM